MKLLFDAVAGQARVWSSRWFLVGVSVLAGIGVVLMQARMSMYEQRAFERAMARVEVVAPASKPEVTQDNIDLALMLYGIDVPANVEHPRLDTELHDRGLTTRTAFMEKTQVIIGPAAFTSWALLGATLAHEVEVHCRQNFFAIYVMDLLGMDGTGAAERQAYAHELKNAGRFGIHIDDAAMIAETMDYYYPESGSVAGIKVPKSVRVWLARNLIRSER